MTQQCLKLTHSKAFGRLVCGAGVPQGMTAKLLLNTGNPAILLNNVYHSPD
jgi:hypothetical protein